MTVSNVLLYWVVITSLSTSSNTFFAFDRCNRKSTSRTRSVIRWHNESNFNFTFHKHPNLASITMFGWNSTQLGESEMDMWCMRNGSKVLSMQYVHNSQSFVWPSSDRLGIFNRNGLIGRPVVIGPWWVTSFASTSPLNAISNNRDVPLAYKSNCLIQLISLWIFWQGLTWWWTTTKSSTIFIANRPLWPSLSICDFFGTKPGPFIK